MCKAIVSRFKNNIFYILFNFWRHSKEALHMDRSFAGEMEHIKKLLVLLGIGEGFVVDIAASDGVSQSCTLFLFRDPSWKGLAVEMDPLKFAKLAFAYSQFKNVYLAHVKVTPNNVINLLKAYEVPQDFTFLNLDIDSYDLFLMKEILNNFKPKLISMEINEKIPPPIYFTVLFDEKHYWQGDHFYGCSAYAATETVKPCGYILESIQYNNAIFIRSDIAQKNNLQDISVEDAYLEGYVKKPNRITMFPWNSDVDQILNISPIDGVKFLEKYFLKYKGKFDLHV